MTTRLRHPLTGRFMAGDCERDCLDQCAGYCGAWLYDTPQMGDDRTPFVAEIRTRSVDNDSGPSVPSKPAGPREQVAAEGINMPPRPCSVEWEDGAFEEPPLVHECIFDDDRHFNAHRCACGAVLERDGDG